MIPKKVDRLLPKTMAKRIAEGANIRRQGPGVICQRIEGQCVPPYRLCANYASRDPNDANNCNRPMARERRSPHRSIRMLHVMAPALCASVRRNVASKAAFLRNNIALAANLDRKRPAGVRFAFNRSAHSVRSWTLHTPRFSTLPNEVKRLHERRDNFFIGTRISETFATARAIRTRD